MNAMSSTVAKLSDTNQLPGLHETYQESFRQVTKLQIEAKTRVQICNQHTIQQHCEVKHQS
jgi:hypothetical protein